MFYFFLYPFSVYYNMKIKLSEWAKKNGIKYRTAWKWVKAEKMPNNVVVHVMPTGTILIEEI